MEANRINSKDRKSKYFIVKHRHERQLAKFADIWNVVVEVFKLLSALLLLFATLRFHFSQTEIYIPTPPTTGQVDEIKEIIPREIKILCLCSTTGPRHEQRAYKVRETWGRRCDKLVFASDVIDEFLPSNSFFDKTGREFVSYKIFNAWKFIFDWYGEEYDWFVKTDDDTFLVVDNLKKFLQTKNPNEDNYFGYRLKLPKSMEEYEDLKTSEKTIEYAAGCVEILSKKTLKRFVREAMTNEEKCPLPVDYENEDVLLGQCLNSIGIEVQDALDDYNRHRILIFDIISSLSVGSADKDNWIWHYRDNYIEGAECCSKDAFAFHYTEEPGQMVRYFTISKCFHYKDFLFQLGMEFMLYHLRPFGL